MSNTHFKEYFYHECCHTFQRQKFGSVEDDQPLDAIQTIIWYPGSHNFESQNVGLFFHMWLVGVNMVATHQNIWGMKILVTCKIQTNGLVYWRVYTSCFCESWVHIFDFTFWIFCMVRSHLKHLQAPYTRTLVRMMSQLTVDGETLGEVLQQKQKQGI